MQIKNVCRCQQLVPIKLPLWTLRASVDPRLDQFAKPLLRSWRGVATWAGIPPPSDEVITCKVLVQEREGASTVAARVFELDAYLTDRLAFPSHLDRRQAPARMSRNALITPFAADDLEIPVGMTGLTGIAGYARAVVPTHDRRGMRAVFVALQGMVAGGMAVHTTRARDGLGCLGEQRAGPCVAIHNALKHRGRPKLASILCPDGKTSRHFEHPCERGNPNKYRHRRTIE